MGETPMLPFAGGNAYATGTCGGGKELLFSNMPEITETTTLNTMGRVPGLSIRDVVRLLAFQLRASSRRIEKGYLIELRNYQHDLYTRIVLTRSGDDIGASDLTVENRKLRENIRTAGVSFADLQHLYITWDKPGQVSFCYASEGRFTLLNVSYEQGMFIINNKDKRALSSQGASSGTPFIPKDRRTFYHIGRLFDQTKAEEVSEEDVVDTDGIVKKAEKQPDETATETKTEEETKPSPFEPKRSKPREESRYRRRSRFSRR